MSLNITKEVTALEQLTVRQLREKYAELFGDGTRTGNKPWLIKRIAWRLQAQAEGGLSERARLRAEELANEADLRLSPPKRQPASDLSESHTVTGAITEQRDNRLPPAGTILTRKYRGRTLQVLVLSEGFEYAGEVYGSLSAVAKQITGSHTNGFLFFKLQKGDRS